MYVYLCHTCCIIPCTIIGRRFRKGRAPESRTKAGVRGRAKPCGEEAAVRSVSLETELELEDTKRGRGAADRRQTGGMFGGPEAYVDVSARRKPESLSVHCKSATRAAHASRLQISRWCKSQLRKTRLDGTGSAGLLAALGMGHRKRTPAHRSLSFLFSSLFLVLVLPSCLGLRDRRPCWLSFCI